MSEFNRNIFTEKPSKMDKYVDILFAIALGIALTGLALSYFDVLVK